MLQRQCSKGGEQVKKEYRKPWLWYENFQLSQSIASGCEGIANFTEGMCSVTLTGPGYNLVLFSDTNICRDTPPNPDDYLCYHAPTEGNNVFSS